ncbi:MAG: hypothetical protein B1H02_00265 [Candidatus Latescibacteria bacterium 4484_107]|nr:MAG: hypothetical protein B1H02_00265 [Candidatus Latescibacteria bacterium 4484_107]
MSNPVELHHLLTSTDVTERVVQLAKVRPDMQQEQFARTFLREADQQHIKPPPPAKMDEVILHREREKEEQGRKKKQEHPSEETDQEQADIVTEQEHHIDILV